ncbi:MAG TPA: M1 family aminopeptidase [Flavobacterium sp.]|nr:M1 family aminopeptidase [Flavobacterium sp.]
MKKYYFLIFFIFGVTVAQTNKKHFNEIVNAEKKGAAKRMAFVTNPDTYNYDVTYEKLEFTVDPAVFNIFGKVTTTYKALADMNTIVFDLAKITDPDEEHFSDQIVVNAVRQNNVDLTFTRNDTELIVNLPATQASGTTAAVEIIYAGAPAGSGFGSFETSEHNGNPILWTLSEPFGAMDWWPCKQDLNDKVDDGIDVYITAPSQYVSVSNGLQQSAISNGNGTTTTHFHHGYAIAAYLIAIAVSNYTVYTQQAGTVPNQFPIVNYMYPESLDSNLENLAMTPQLIAYYESIFTPYPFSNEKYGHCQFGWGGGMEHQTVSFMVGFERGLVAHELAHQWFGDKVTCGSWSDIWLNEGFATYLAAMSTGHFDGDWAFDLEKMDLVNSITSSPNGSVYIPEDEATNVNRIFDGRLTYNKGAMVLHMLRFKMGDTAFFTGLQNYLNDPGLAYGYAATTDLKSHLEATSGMDLTEFFNDWVYRQGYPIYTIAVHNTSAGHAMVTINQTQSDPSVTFFKLPVPIRLLGPGSQQFDVVLDNTVNGEVFNIDVPFAAYDVLFNPKNDIVSAESTAVLGAQNFDLVSGISLYPNPAENKLALSIPSDVNVEKTTFYNTLGQKVKESGSETNWDISALQSGVYFITVYTDSGTKQLKFIKK